MLSQVETTKASRKAAAERANKLVRDAEPALEQVKRMREEAHTQRCGGVEVWTTR